MTKERCPYCHKYIATYKFDDHCKAHEKLRADGQQEAYVTLPTEMRSNESLKGEPKVYKHSKCGQMTEMPEDIIRSYLVNPYLYLADESFCTGCGTHVPAKECHWVETGENMQTHIDRLRKAKPEFRPNLRTRLSILISHQKWVK